MAGLDDQQLREREGAVTAVATFLDELCSARGTSLFILGEGGLGKTSILQLALSLAGGRMRTGLGRGHETEQGLPFGLISQAIDDLGDGGLLRHPRLAETASEMIPPQFEGVLRWLREVQEPTLIALDDIHWADADSLGLINFLCRRLSSVPVGVIATMRPWPPPAAELGGALATSGLSTMETLRPLSVMAAGELIGARTGASSSDELAERAHALTAGNPLLLEQLAAVLKDRGGSDREGLSPAAHLLCRLAGHPGVSTRFVQAAAVLGTQFAPDLAGLVAELDGGDRDITVSALRLSGLIRSAAEGRLEFVHPIFRESVYNDLDRPLALRLHRRAFAILVDRGMEREAVEHALHGRPVADAEATRVLHRAGAAELRSGALAAAVLHLQSAAHCAGATASNELLTLLGEALLASGRTAQAIDLMRRVISDQPGSPPSERAQPLRVLGRALSMTGEHAEASRRLDEARALSGEGTAETAEILLDHSLTLWLTGGPVAARPLVERACALAKRLGDLALERRALASWGFVAAQCGDASGFDVARSAAEPLVGNPLDDPLDLARMWGGLSLHARMTVWSEDFAESEQISRAVIAAAERLGAVGSIVSEATGLAHTLVRLGRLAEASELLGKAEGIVEFHPSLASMTALTRALVMHRSGEEERSQALCSQVEPIARTRGEWLALMTVLLLQGERCLQNGRAVRARQHFLELEAWESRVGLEEPCVVPWHRQALYAHVASGHLADAERLIATVKERAHRLPCRWPRIVTATGLALIADRRGEPESAERHFGDALELHEGVELPLERAETLLQYARLLRRRGEPARARYLLQEAQHITEECGAGGLRGLIIDEVLVAAGRRRRGRSGDHELTSQERRVAGLAGSGLSNRAIANQMLLSVTTVESHLRHIFSKLGITSRHELEARHRSARQANG